MVIFNGTTAIFHDIVIKLILREYFLIDDRLFFCIKLWWRHTRVTVYRRKECFYVVRWT